MVVQNSPTKVLKSLVSYPTRGAYGDARWQGNCSGHLIRELLEYYRPKVFVDPAEGGGTSRAVCDALKATGWNIVYHGFDLKNDFNLLKDNLARRIGERRADYVFFHPPYHSIIRYSGAVWGSEPHPDDLSRCRDYPDFLTKMTVALENIYGAVRQGGNYSILIGDIRQAGKYTSIQADLLQLAPGTLDGIIIKAQHNCASDARNYSGKFIPIMHEYLLNFRKSTAVFGMLDRALAASEKLQMLSSVSWSAVVRCALDRLGGIAKLSDIYEFIETTVGDKTRTRPNWKARVRAELQAKFRSVERGVWALYA